jgi:hypothetical protein
VVSKWRFFPGPRKIGATLIYTACVGILTVVNI